jgi:hypothetical protein
MFYKYRFADRSVTWAVLLIRSEVLWDLDCAFCWANAACSAISQLPLAVLKEVASLQKMFADGCEVSGVARASCAIPDSYPTNPQAEVLVFCGVPLSYITAAYFYDSDGRARFSPQPTALTVGVNRTYFDARRDFRIWKQVAEPSSGESWQDAPFSVPS